MKEELQSKLVEILSGMQTAVGKASDFALEQLPDIAQSYVMYGRAFYSLALVLCLVLVIGLLWNLIRIAKNPAGECSWSKKPELIGMQELAIFASGVGVLFGSIGFFVNLSGALLVWFAPKVWLLKELAALAR